MSGLSRNAVETGVIKSDLIGCSKLSMFNCLFLLLDFINKYVENPIIEKINTTINSLRNIDLGIILSIVLSSLARNIGLKPFSNKLY
ncbi:MAG: hypothetical protein LCH20_02835 [Proteobacteria bacterium]|nr:hypothetical protein [Pseudomonadota bacterium]